MLVSQNLSVAYQVVPIIFHRVDFYYPLTNLAGLSPLPGGVVTFFYLLRNKQVRILDKIRSS